MFQDLVESFSGIRGIYGQSITEELAQKYAQAYWGSFKKKIKILVIGGDPRNSTPLLKKAMLRAFQNCGVKKIIDVGVVPIQVCQHSILKFKAQGGVYITASHNPPKYNGWKFLKEDGALLYPEQAEKLIKIAHKTQEQKIATKKLKKARIINKNKEAIENYLNFILKKIGKKGLKSIRRAKFKILLDPNGGSAIPILEKLFKKLEIQTKIINDKLGKFSRPIEPNFESLVPLSKKVNQAKFDFGCGFDCDADRVEFVLPADSEFTEEMGVVLSGQYVLALASEAYLKGKKNQIVVTNDCTSYLVKEIIKKYKARTKEVEVGEINVVKEMERQKSIIGGEGSNGGVIIPPIKCRDGIMTIVLILKMLADRKKSLAEILENYPRYFSDRTKLKCSSRQALKIKKKLEKYFKIKEYKIKKTAGSRGGLKILFDHNSFLWFRQSKTEPGTFRIIADGDNHKKVKKMLKKGIKLFNKFKR
ncbi:MAG: hypothetical protein QMC93_03375 [Patescibacteria group bacterium]|nr:hypothetical protein [Patescibacteria group bacterium]